MLDHTRNKLNVRFRLYRRALYLYLPRSIFTPNSLHIFTSLETGRI